MIFPLSYSIADVIHNRRCAVFDPLFVLACARVAPPRSLRFAFAAHCVRTGGIGPRRPSKSAPARLIVLAPQPRKA
jgi:hypothetical protein